MKKYIWQVFDDRNKEILYAGDFTKAEEKLQHIQKSLPWPHYTHFHLGKDLIETEE